MLKPIYPMKRITCIILLAIHVCWLANSTSVYSGFVQLCISGQPVDYFKPTQVTGTVYRSLADNKHAIPAITVLVARQRLIYEAWRPITAVIPLYRPCVICCLSHRHGSTSSQLFSNAILSGSRHHFSTSSTDAIRSWTQQVSISRLSLQSHRVLSTAARLSLDANSTRL
jgi:hypothetical protein